MEAALVLWLLGTSTQIVFSFEFFPWIFFLRVMCPFGLVPPLVGRAASGRALAPEPPRATRSQTEPIRTAADNGLFLFLQFPFLWFFSSLFFPLVFLQHFSQVFTKSPTTSYFDIPRFPTLACKDCSRVGTGQFEKSGR